VHAVLGKAARAEPVAALYEQRRVAHAGGLAALEEELLGLGAEGLGERSPDRADALVWAISELMLGRAEGPRARWL
ncbi:MAG: DNA-packaging protein, partial [Brevundimonas sp.]|nr:DNA-packaging protein [Brevundimonas sp.]